MKQKIFCIGLHKTGTCTLHDLALQAGFNSIHDVTWQYDKVLLDKYNFFCDGGSHYNNQNEFPYKKLLEYYPDCYFILNIRNIKKWIVSKCKHAGWNINTVIDYSPRQFMHDDWKIKSLTNIELFIQHYFKWYSEIITYFMDKKEKALLVDIEQQLNIDKLNKLFDTQKLRMVHKNRSSTETIFPAEVNTHIDNQIDITNLDNLLNLKALIAEFQNNHPL